MPKLILFAPCERVIVEQGANTVSLIALLQELTAPIPVGTELPTNAVAPQRWYVLAVWTQESSDRSKWFQQHVILTGPDEQIKVEVFTDFEFTKETHRNIVTIDGFPIGLPGNYTLALELREKGHEQWSQVGAYPMKVAHSQVVNPQLA